MGAMRILLLSAYDAASHQYWRESLMEAEPESDWTVLTLPPRHFAWRVGGNALSFGLGEHETLSKPYDLIIATSLTDIATIKGLYPNLAATRTIVYFHENQFAYPESEYTRAQNIVEAQMRSIYSALAADTVQFNSEFNRRTFLDGANALLTKLPDHVPSGVCATIEAKSEIRPVPLHRDAFISPIRDPEQPLMIVWNHRWEYDKGPDRLLLVLRELKTAGLDFRIHVIGQQFRQQPEAFAQIKTEFAEQIGEWGFIESREAYREVLCRSHIVLSTALHDFQGLAMQEGIAAGCIPVAPNRLAYPEYIPAENLSESLLDNASKEAVSISRIITSFADILRH